MKYNVQSTIAALIWNIDNRKRAGKRSNIYKNKRLFNQSEITSYLKKKGLTKDKLLQQVSPDACMSMPRGFTFTSPPPEEQQRASPSSGCAVTPPSNIWYVQTPQTLSVESAPSGLNGRFTPQSSQDSSLENCRGTPSDPTIEQDKSIDTDIFRTSEFVGEIGTEWLDIPRISLDRLNAAQELDLARFPGDLELGLWTSSSNGLETTSFVGQQGISDLLDDFIPYWSETAGQECGIPVLADPGNVSSFLGHSELGPGMADNVDNQFETVAIAQQPDMIAMSAEAILYCSGGKYSTGNKGEASFHSLMTKPLQDGVSYQDLRWNLGSDLWPSSMPASDSQPEAFVGLCFLVCILRGQERVQEADMAASAAFHVYRRLVLEGNEHALACLNIVLAVLFMYGQKNVALDLLKNAREAALSLPNLHEEHSFIVTITFMMSQATSTALECGVSVARLRTVFDDFLARRSLMHPYTVIAGYHLAWRLALSGGKGLFQAHDLLSNILGAAEATLGYYHMQTIAILTTKARMLHNLESWEEAVALMSEAMDRIEVSYSAVHPYALEAKRRHAIFLSKIPKVRLAEAKWKEVAIARVEVFGPRHQFSVASVRDVEKFLCKEGRETELERFRRDLTRAEARSNPQRPPSDMWAWLTCS